LETRCLAKREGGAFAGAGDQRKKKTRGCRNSGKGEYTLQECLERGYRKGHQMELSGVPKRGGGGGPRHLKKKGQRGQKKKNKHVEKKKNAVQKANCGKQCPKKRGKPSEEKRGAAAGAWGRGVKKKGRLCSNSFRPKKRRGFARTKRDQFAAGKRIVPQGKRDNEQYQLLA